MFHMHAVHFHTSLHMLSSVDVEVLDALFSSQTFLANTSLNFSQTPATSTTVIHKLPQQHLRHAERPCLHQTPSRTKSCRRAFIEASLVSIIINVWPSLWLTLTSDNQSEVITILVGAEEHRFTAHKDVICDKSKFFRAACSDR
jgi:hypothetical protein